MNLKKILYITIFIFLINLIIFFYFILVPFKANNSFSSNILITIPPNSSIKQIASQLYNSEIIKNPIVFRILVKITLNEHNLKAGEYELPLSNNLLDVLKKIKNGEFKKYKITIPEGLTYSEIADILKQQGIANKDIFLQIAKNKKILQKYNIEADSIEGYLFPDTYIFFKGISEEKIIDNMLTRFSDIYNEDFEKRAKEINLTRHKVIILASIVEKEAMEENERKIIAAVFLNRLKKHMKLESCATVLYAIGKHKNKLFEEDLKVESPYNTYLYAGLPYGPISNPGRASIYAVLYPEKIDHLYFVSRNDGTHEFTNTFKEHVRNKRKFIK